MAITLGLVEAVDDNGVYVSMPGARGVLRGPYETLQNVAVGDRVLVVTTDDGENVIVGQAAATSPRSVPATSTDNAVARFDGTGGALQNSGVTIDDSGSLVVEKALGLMYTGQGAARFVNIPGDAENIRLENYGGAARLLEVSGLRLGGSGGPTITGTGGIVTAAADTDGGLDISGATTASVRLSAGYDQVQFRTATGDARWVIAKAGGTEVGDSGSELEIDRFDSGGGHTNVLVNRSTGRWTFFDVGLWAGLELGSGGPREMVGTGSPEGAVTAPTGSVWRQTDHATLGYCRWFKATGTGNTGWLPDFEGRWIGYTPTLTASTTNPTNWTQTGYYTRAGNLVICKFILTAGASMTAGSGYYRVALPVNANANHFAETATVGLYDSSSGNQYHSCAVIQAATYVQLQYQATHGGALTVVQHNAPWTWAANDTIRCGQLTYEIA